MSRNGATAIDFPLALRGFLSARGHELRDRELAVVCFGHEDTRPSLRIDLERGIGHCDVCDAGGGALDLVQGLEGCDQARALAILSGSSVSSPSQPPPVAPRPGAKPPADLAAVLERARRALDGPEARYALEWLEKHAGVSREVLDRYLVGLGAPVKLTTPDGRLVETFSLAAPSFIGGKLSGLKLYRWRAKEIAGEAGAKLKAISEKGSRPGLVGGHLLGEAAGKTVLIVGGEKDVLVAGAAAPELVVLANARGEGGWTHRRGEPLGVKLAREIVAAKPARLVVALDANERERGALDAVACLHRAGAAEVRVLEYAADFAVAEPKGGVAQLVLARGAEVLGSLVEAAPVAPRPAASPGDSEDARPVIEVSEDILAMVEAGERALLAARIELYVHGRGLARVLRDEKGPRLDPLPMPIAKGLLARAAHWTRAGRDGEVRNVLPPRDVVESFVAKGSWPFPLLEAIVTSPTLRADGTIVDRPGYDRTSRVILEPDGKYPTIPERPSREDARHALADLAEVFCDFPFVGECDRSAALALVMTLLARPSIDGPVPMTVVRANTPGTGKSLLVDVAAAIGTGRRAARLTLARSAEEEEKKLVALGREGAALALIDNLERPLGSEVLAAALTARTYKARLLGGNTMAEFLIPVFTATGNNLAVIGDLGRRVVPVDLEVRLERPEERSGFLHELPSWALANRPRLVAAALTALRGFFVAGCPRQALSPYGSFEEWSRLVRGALVWLGRPDPCEGRVRIREEGDLALAELREALAEWSRVLGPEPHTAAHVLVASERDHGLRDALCGLAATDALKLDARRLGYALRKAKGRLVDGLRFERVSEDRLKGVRWRVGPVASPASPVYDPRITRESTDGGESHLAPIAGDAGHVSESLNARARAHTHTREGSERLEGSPASPDHPHAANGVVVTRPLSPGWVEDPEEGDRG